MYLILIKEINMIFRVITLQANFPKFESSASNLVRKYFFIPEAVCGRRGCRGRR
jgi:hypothetical protein